MYSSMILSITTFVYGLSSFLYTFSWIFRKPAVIKPTFYVTILGIVGNVIGIVLRWFESYSLGFGHAPFTNLYESLLFFSLVIAVVFVVVDRKYEMPIVGAFALPLSFWSLAYAAMSPNISEQIQPLIPALNSNWLIAHVITCFIGYAAFAVGVGVSIMYILKQSKWHRSGGWLSLLPDAGALDILSHQLVAFGFFFLSIGIITGAVWANSAWGRYWGWDPKETWSFITWIVYATVLHTSNLSGWRGKKVAYLSIIGFAAVLFTYFGVNYLPGLHSYGS